MSKLDRRGKDYERPRRPNPDTISYLISLPLDVHASQEEISAFLKNPESTEFPQSLAAALTVLQEIHNEIASLAGEEQSAEMIETLIRIAAPYSEHVSQRLLQSVQGYLVHLATHRYGSHVLQTLLQAVNMRSCSQDLALHRDAPPVSDNESSALPSLGDLLLVFQEEIAPFAGDMAVHMCGSHVIRALICVLGGVEQRSHPGAPTATNSNPFRRGKAKSKKKKKNTEGNSSNAMTPSFLVYTENPRMNVNDPTFTKALERLSFALTGDSVHEPGELQELACDSSGGPLLSLLLRVWTYRRSRDEWMDRLTAFDKRSGIDRHLGVLRPEPRFGVLSEASKLAERIICWKNGEEEQPWASEVVFGLAGEPRGSRLLETLLLVASDEMYTNILCTAKLTTGTTLQEYIKEPVSRYVVQTLLGTLRDKAQAEIVLQALEPLVVQGVVLVSEPSIRSILWRMVEVAGRFGICQESLLKQICRGVAAVERKAAQDVTLQQCVSFLLQPKNELSGERISLSVPGARTVYQLLRFMPKNCKAVIAGLLELPQDVLEMIVKDGMGSRCVIDAILEGSTGEGVFNTARSRLVKALSGRWAALSTDRVAHHATIKLVAVLKDMEAKKVILDELVKGKKRLSDNNMGRRVLQDCMIHEYEMNGAEEWSRIFRKRQEKATFMEDIFAVSNEHAKRLRPEKDSISDKKRAKRGDMVDSIVNKIAFADSDK